MRACDVYRSPRPRANTGRLTSIRTPAGQRRFREEEVLAALDPGV
jgi:hypothetical protein